MKELCPFCGKEIKDLSQGCKDCRYTPYSSSGAKGLDFEKKNNADSIVDKIKRSNTEKNILTGTKRKYKINNNTDEFKDRLTQGKEENTKELNSLKKDFQDAEKVMESNGSKTNSTSSIYTDRTTSNSKSDSDSYANKTYVNHNTIRKSLNMSSKEVAIIIILFLATFSIPFIGMIAGAFLLSKGKDSQYYKLGKGFLICGIVLSIITATIYIAARVAV